MPEAILGENELQTVQIGPRVESPLESLFELDFGDIDIFFGEAGVLEKGADIFEEELLVRKMRLVVQLRQCK